MLPEILYLRHGFLYSSVQRQETYRLRFVQRDERHCHPLLFIQIQNMTMSPFYADSGSLDMNETVDDMNIDETNDDDELDAFDENADQPLNRPKASFVVTRDPLVAALFGDAVCA
jgi:hypothetical protein